jgi:hypothetical protein
MARGCNENVWHEKLIISGKQYQQQPEIAEK